MENIIIPSHIEKHSLAILDDVPRSVLKSQSLGIRDPDRAVEYVISSSKLKMKKLHPKLYRYLADNPGDIAEILNKLDVLHSNETDYDTRVFIGKYKTRVALFAKTPAVLFELSIALGHTDVMEYARNHPRFREGLQSTSLCLSAVHKQDFRLFKDLHEWGCPWDIRTCNTAAYYGDLPILEYAHANGCKWDIRVFSIAASKGHFNCFQYAQNNGCPHTGDNGTVFASAAKGGNMNIFISAHVIGFKWDYRTIFESERCGNLKCLIYANENGCPWGPDVGFGAIEGDHVHCLEYLYNSNLKLTKRMYLKTREGSKCRKFLVSKNCYNPYWQ